MILLPLAGCGGGRHDESLLGSPGASPPKGASTAAAANPEQRFLDRRAKAVLDDDVQAFLAPVALDEPALQAGQRRLFDNLQRLPVEALSFARDGGGRILRKLTLRGFDRGPEVGLAGFGVERGISRRLVRLRTLGWTGADKECG